MTQTMLNAIVCMASPVVRYRRVTASVSPGGTGSLILVAFRVIEGPTRHKSVKTLRSHVKVVIK